MKYLYKILDEVGHRMSKVFMNEKISSDIGATSLVPPHKADVAKCVGVVASHKFEIVLKVLKVISF